MKNLTTRQITALYLLAFQVGEWGPDNQDSIEESIDFLLRENNQITLDNIIPDEDGGPINAHQVIYDDYNAWIGETEDDEMPYIIDLEAIKEDETMTPEILFTLLPAA